MYLYLSFLLVLLFMDSVLHFVRIGCARACESVLYKTARATAAVVRRRRRRLAEKQDPRLEQISLSLSLLNDCVNDASPFVGQRKGEHRDDDAPLKRSGGLLCSDDE